MVAPNQHYHRIETADMQQDVMYYLTRLDGQLVRLNEMLKTMQNNQHGGVDNLIQIVHSAQAFALSLRNALSPDRFDVL